MTGKDFRTEVGELKWVTVDAHENVVSEDKLDPK